LKRLAALLALLIAIQYTSCLHALSATATFSGNGAQAQVPVSKIGALMLADAVAFLNNDSIEVRSKSSQDSSQNMLQGTVLNTEIRGAGASRHIHGIAFFQSGSSLGGVCKKGGGPERVKTSSGEILSGAISNVTADGLNVGSSRVPAGGISCIDSPCAFEFDIPLSGASGTSSVTGEASKISFSQCNLPVTTTKVREKEPKVSSGEPNTKMRIVVCTLLLAGIATAIAVPIAVGPHRHHHRHRDNSQQILLQRFLAERARTPTESVMQSISNPFGSSSSSSNSSP